MKEINFDDVLFHGLTNFFVGTERFEKSLQRLDLILKTNAILSREQQDKILPQQGLTAPSYENKLFNNYEYVSVCQKNSNHIEEKKESMSYNAFVDYATGILLDRKLLEELDFRKSCPSKGYHMDDGEFQVKGCIPSQYFIGLFTSMASDEAMLQGLKDSNYPIMAYNDTNHLGEIFLSSQEYGLYSKETFDHFYSGTEKIREIMNEHGYDLPIYSSIDGKLITNADNVYNQFIESQSCSSTQDISQ